ncbi:MAG: N-6 DNA methylase [Mojavia pulchra JT2-VF2]|jgi:type I restriction enzyme M protein|uniref:site-specific DNA-methyltransferase (adenine-specific) n=1 Tax=Mojavia pulchra JT2-VF2 TaxID=287848 RepID=A0A951UII6_9NOST|nr:N-6 DNA methylase [Mojavia pulchra JT2-VF2]
MANESSSIVQKLWNYCNVLRDDGVSYSDYVEQLTYLLFLKMVEEQNQLPPPLGKRSTIPPEYSWEALRSQDGDALETQYRHTLENLGKEKGLLGVIFRKSQNKIQDPAKLKRLVELINSETWIGLDIDVKGEIYEGLLQKNAEDVKGGAGQYFTPRALIKAIVEVMQPQPGQLICDPACGTGGFLLVAYDFITKHYKLDKDQRHFLKHDTFKGFDVADGVVRLCAMNLCLHGIAGDNNLVEAKDSLMADPGDHFEFVLTNPPFGIKRSITVLNNEAKADKAKAQEDNFWVTTSNIQLNFLQHVKNLLKINGKAAVVVADNVLFEGGAGETIRKKLLDECNVHTLLRLPTGIFYAQGVKANVLFFDRKPASTKPWTKKLWVYDLRTNQDFNLKNNLFGSDNLQEFMECFNTENFQERQETQRFRSFTYEELIKRDKVNLDIIWLKNDVLKDFNNSITKANSLEIKEVGLANFINNDSINQVIELFHLLSKPELVVDNCINQIRGELKKSLKNIIDAADAKTKGNSLEDFTQMLFGCLEYLKFYKRNLENVTGEIDVIFAVKKIPGTLFAEFSDLLIVECKNWNKPVGVKEIRIFSTKMDELDSKVGIIISKNGISGDKDNTKDALGFIRNIWLQSPRKIILVFNLEDLQSIVNGTCNLYELLQEKYFSVKTMSNS